MFVFHSTALVPCTHAYLPKDLEDGQGGAVPGWQEGSFWDPSFSHRTHMACECDVVLVGPGLTHAELVTPQCPRLACLAFQGNSGCSSWTISKGAQEDPRTFVTGALALGCGAEEQYQWGFCMVGAEAHAHGPSQEAQDTDAPCFSGLPGTATAVCRSPPLL